MKPSFMKQTDSRWSAKRYKTKDGGYPSVGGAGCGPSCIANVVDALIKPITPLTVFKYACEKGYMTGNSGTYWDGMTKMLKHYGIDKFSVTSDSGKAKKSLKDGKWVIGVVGPSRWTRGGHYILLYGLTKSDKCLISDPASYSDYRQKDGPFSEFAHAENCCWVSIDPKDYTGSNKHTAKGVNYTYWISDLDGGNVRKGRGTKYETVKVLKHGTKLTLTELKNKWWKIATGKYKGMYIHQHNLSKYEPYKATFKVLPSVGLRVRKGYTTSSEILKVLPKGTKVTCSKRKGRWVYIPKQKGWMCVKDDSGTYLKEIK